MKVNGTRYPEKEMLSLFLGTCEAVRAMHRHTSGPSAAYPPPPKRTVSSSHTGETTEEEDNDHLGDREGDALISGNARIEEEAAAEEGGVVGHADGAIVMGKLENAVVGESSGKDMPWAHRDIKPVS